MADLHGWQADPFGLHEQRYFSQGQPTKLVRDQGRESYDPPPNQESGDRQQPVSRHVGHSSDTVAAAAGAQQTEFEPSNPLPPVHPPRSGDARWEVDSPLAQDSHAARSVAPPPASPIPPTAPSPEAHISPRPADAPTAEGLWRSPHANSSHPAGVDAFVPIADNGHYPTAPPRPPEPPPPQGSWFVSELTSNHAPTQSPAATPGSAPPVDSPRSPEMQKFGGWQSSETPWGQVGPVGPPPTPPPPWPGWWLASDGNWYPPESASHLADAPTAQPPTAQQQPSPASTAPPLTPPSSPPGPGWWLASDGNWYPPELATPSPEPATPQPEQLAAPAEVATAFAPEPGPQPDVGATTPSPTPPGPGWWLASDGNWYPPELATPGQGWWLASDGNWYPPETPPGQGWWLASDGNWYPPELAAPSGSESLPG
jgi:hypothetical protein